MISGHERVGEWREALSLAQVMERVEGVSPTVVTFNSVIGACKRARKPAEALAVLGLMRRKGIKPDVISYNSAISACSRCDAGVVSGLGDCQVRGGVAIVLSWHRFTP